MGDDDVPSFSFVWAKICWYVKFYEGEKGKYYPRLCYPHEAWVRYLSIREPSPCICSVFWI